MPDENIVFNRDAFADEGVARYLAAPAHLGVLLNLDEGPYFGLFADLTAIQVDELRELDVLAELYIRGNTAVFVHRRTNSPLFRIDRSAASSIRTMRSPA